MPINMDSPFSSMPLDALSMSSTGATGSSCIAGFEQLLKQLISELSMFLRGAGAGADAGGSSPGMQGSPGVLTTATGSPDITPSPASPPASGSTSGAGPTKVNLSEFGQLQLPSGSNGNVDTISGNKLSSYSSQYFQQNSNGSITFNVPSGGGAHTANSSFPRSELEENGSWHMSDGTTTLSATLSVDKLPPNGDIVIGQIHQKSVDGAKPRPPVELHYDNGNIVASIMDSNSPNAGRHDVTIATGVKPGQSFSYSMKLQPNGQLDISAAGQSKTVSLDPSFQKSDMYCKAGNYCQDPAGGSSVTFTGLNITHQKS
ncbi:polysaccharide lyase family 7 protein [Paraburkholderia humisilvae]|uniref:Alginate lyase 2 domain-containing protein n=1 Tax=Paraburkholderia humisilvae TaxID=627669 RepID=A0A6J5EH11_9BURK|nr:polysaccharide lyase family 7 protein [Paraburkholderia humisilvae]CAB3764325.1 hypothetical protein LMG29542_04858 [Paraburkholderia humisilvae]